MKFVEKITFESQSFNEDVFPMSIKKSSMMLTIEAVGLQETVRRGADLRESNRHAGEGRVKLLARRGRLAEER